MPRGRPRKRDSDLSSNTSAAQSETDSTAGSLPPRSSRRGRVPKRFLDDAFEFAQTPVKRRATTSTSSASETTPQNLQQQAEAKPLKIKVKPITPPPPPASTATSSEPPKPPKPRGRPPRKPGAKKGGRPPKEKQPWVDEFEHFEEEESEDDDSDDEYVLPRSMLDEVEEDLDLDGVKAEEIEPEAYDDHGFEPWMETDPAKIPRLELPDSSHDIPLPQCAIFDVIEIYEILRSYHRTLRLTPFAFEDFCAALISNNNSCLIAEIHISLLKICLKSDDEEQTHYSVTETNNAINIMFHHLETMTFAEILRQYIEAYPGVDFSVRDAINTENYPYVGYEPKIVVLLFMCYRFLYSSEYRKVVNNVGKLQNDDACRVCGKSNGRVVGCTRCDASFHVDCSSLDPFPDILVCNLCTQNNVRGMSDSRPFDEPIDREPLRMKPIGKDRHGRTYWFVVRRIIVQSDDDSDLRYYSTPPQLYELLQSLDAEYYERELCSFIKEKVNDMLEQMTVTLEMNVERRQAVVHAALARNPEHYVEYVESMIPECYLHKDNSKRMAKILRVCAEKATIKQEIKEEEGDDEASRMSGPLEVKKEETVLSEQNLGIFDGRLINNFWSGGLNEDELVNFYLEKLEEPIVPEFLFRFGDEKNDQGFMLYINYYANNDMAESVATRKRTVDKKKYMSAKFSFSDNPQLAFEWSLAKDKGFYGNEVLQNKLVQWTIAKLARRIPIELMHRRWPLEVVKFDETLRNADNFRELANCLLRLDCAIRKTVFVQQWWSGVGQLKLQRNTLEQREMFSKQFQKTKKFESDALAKELDESFVKVNYIKPKFPNTYICRQRGETYRNAGKGEMSGWLWMSHKYASNLVKLPEKPTLPTLGEDGKAVVKEHESTSNKKALKLEKLIEKIKKKLEPKPVEIEGKATSSCINMCYSPSCRLKTVERPVCRDIDPNLMQSCYSANCRKNAAVKNENSVEQPTKVKRGIIGEGIPWPIPEPHQFLSKSVRSIFVLEKKILRKMIKVAGCEPVYIPGFSQTAKSNLLVWNYPAPRPCLDLCWRWMTLNARSLHAVALQLKILWSSIRWSDMEPEDVHPDRRVVIDMPTHDERRKIVAHKEMGPFGQYERYLMDIEIIPLVNEDDEEEDQAWSAKKEREGGSVTRTTVRKKRNANGMRVPKAIRREWMDGVDLKLFEIKDYWRDRIRLRETERKRLLALRAKELAKKAPPPPTPQPPAVQTRNSGEMRMPQAIRSHHITNSPQRQAMPGVPNPGIVQGKAIPAPGMRYSPAASLINGNRFMPKHIRTGAEPPSAQRYTTAPMLTTRRDSKLAQVPTPQRSQPQPQQQQQQPSTPGLVQVPTPRTVPNNAPRAVRTQRVMYAQQAAPPRPVLNRHPNMYVSNQPVSRSQQFQYHYQKSQQMSLQCGDYRDSQIPSTSRAPGGRDNIGMMADGMQNGDNSTSSAATVPSSSGLTRPEDHLASAVAYGMSMPSHRGAQVAQVSRVANGTQPIVKYQQVYSTQTRNVQLQPVGEPQTEMRRATMPTGAEESVGANGSDADEQPPVIPRYDRNTIDNPDQQRPIVRQFYAANANPNMNVRRPGGAAKNAVFVIKRPDGVVQNNMIVRNAPGNVNQDGTSPMVYQQPPGSRVVTMRPGTGGQQIRSVMNQNRVVRVTGATRYPIPTGSGGQQMTVQTMQRTVPIRSVQPEFEDEQGQEFVQVQGQQYSTVPGNVTVMQKNRFVQRGGTTMHLAQQQQMVPTDPSTISLNDDLPPEELMDIEAK